MLKGIVQSLLNTPRHKDKINKDYFIRLPSFVRQVELLHSGAGEMRFSRLCVLKAPVNGW